MDFEKPRYYPQMSKERLIGYCQLHCQTPRALFHKTMIAQMVEYAGNPSKYSSAKEIYSGHPEWASLHEEMEDLIKIILENDKKEAERNLLLGKGKPIKIKEFNPN